MKKSLLALALLIAAPAFAQEHTIKIATLAPEGSLWMNRSAPLPDRVCRANMQATGLPAARGATTDARMSMRC